MRVKLVLCREMEQTAVPTPLPRHIVAPIALCRELKEINIDELPSDVIEMIKEKGYTIIDNPKKALDTMGVNIVENEYVKIFIVEH